MNWDGHSIVVLGVFILGQFIILIWRLSAIETKVNSICQKVREIDDIEHRLTNLESRCDERHKT